MSTVYELRTCGHVICTHYGPKSQKRAIKSETKHGHEVASENHFALEELPGLTEAEHGDRVLSKGSKGCSVFSGAWEMRAGDEHY